MSPPVPTPELHARFSTPGAAATPWEDVVAALESAELFWISTVRADGRPHVTPLPAVWHDGALHFCTGPDEQKAVNLRANEACALTTGTNRWKAGLDVVVEGRAERVTDDALLRDLAAMWAAKYDGDWSYEVRDGAFVHPPGAAHVFEVRPTKVLSFAKGDFAQTRFRFGGGGPSHSVRE
jgi:nitroimidazol reductase NimA-like FMN-containing flavoprotein (pyridoxamine 5'-phosphate oxidase superfamily)